MVMPIWNEFFKFQGYPKNQLILNQKQIDTKSVNGV